MDLFITILFIGFIGAFISGLVGIGGAIIIVPMLYFIPPLFGLTGLSMQESAAISIVQVLVATGTAALVHKSNKTVNTDLVMWMGSSIIVASFIGGMGSKYVDETTLQIVFASLALIAAIMMFIPKKEVNSEEVVFNKPLAVLSAAVVGILAGLIGAGGSFLLVPVMLYILKIPLRVTIGSSLGIVFFSAVAGFAGKVLTGQIMWFLSLAIIIGAIPGANLGSKISNKVPAKTLKLLLALLISGSAIKMWLNIL
ncbi:Sulfite exporter TauE/SafE [Desulfonispora thiosulfatigenes DSM 11270]|uniref:Probable membrane transporter protein n=1 Tax=Desulfonispora thiosulfatigenes DSM 11270 TaxID=656914 RepID=A0A1W1V254_DESTI|nr:sulfite exporter TauE/SafE family protein [Desulfonispora thiosulfatigenes]SMB87403.1 Sulfite exporter TauE/SafE [Desulfonispora thiosulfatigenes DSM 11270]